MDNVAEKLCFVELVERLARLRRFLFAEQQSGDPRTHAIVAVFIWAVDGILKSLDPIAGLLSADRPLNASERLACARKSFTAFELFDKLHWQLSQIRGHWVTPEAHVFVDKVLEFMPSDRRKRSISIVPLNEYSFEEDDLATCLRYLLANESVPFDTVADRPTVYLPKIERDNPLYWANLVHECGHTDEEGLQELLNDTALFPEGTNPEHRETLEKWAEELYCDLFAIKILGPAYLASFVACALIAAGLDGGEYGCESHPPDIVRICLMRRMLDKKELKVPLSGDLGEFQDLAHLFYLANESRNELERHHLTSGPPEDAPDLLPVDVAQFADTIIDRVDTIAQHDRELKPEDFGRTPQLAKRLSEGVLIGSYRDTTSIEDALKAIPTKTQSEDGLGVSRELQSSFAKVKGVIQETHTLPWEIMNAGWLHKADVLYPYAFSLFFSRNGSLAEKIGEFNERLTATDEVLLKSIEVSQIHEMFQPPAE